MATISDRVFMARVDDDLISGYERRHPEIGSLKEKEKQIVSARRYELLWGIAFGTNFIILASLLAMYVLVLAAPDNTPHSVGMEYIPYCIIAVLIGYIFTLSRLVRMRTQWLLYRKELSSFRQSLEKLSSLMKNNAGPAGSQLYAGQFVWTGLFLTARDILLAKAEFKRRCKNVDYQTEKTITTLGLHILNAERAFKESFNTANGEFGLEYDKRRIFSRAQSDIEENNHWSSQ